MPLSFPDIVQFAFKVGRSPRLLGAVTAADALVGLLGLDKAQSNWRPAGPGGPAQTRGSAPRPHANSRPCAGVRAPHLLDYYFVDGLIGEFVAHADRDDLLAG